MKKRYKKPMLVIEMYSLTQTIARDCADSIPKDQVNFSDIPNCVWDLGGGMTVFVEGTSCTLDGESMGFACYNNPGEGMYVFRS